MALTTATIIALGGAAVGGSINLIQAGKARAKQREADKAAGRLMAEAKSKLEKNFYEGLKLPTEAYDQAYEANAQTQRENVEALQQADSRSLAAGVGKVGALSNENTQKIRAQQAQEMFELDKLKAGAKEDMNQQLAAMDVAGAQDQAARAAQADEQVGQLQAGAAQAFIGGITAAAESQSLNKMSKTDRALAKTYEDNEALFKSEGIDRNVFLNNPSNYKIENGKITIVNPVNTNTKVKNNNNSNVTVDETEYQDYFEPKVDYAFSYGDRLNSLGLPQDTFS